MTRRIRRTAASLVPVVIAAAWWFTTGAETNSPSRTAEYAGAAYGAPEPAAELPAADLERNDPAEPSAVDQLLAGLTLVDALPAVPGYDRGCGTGERCVFGPAWTDDSTAPSSHNGCDTRIICTQF